MSSRSSRHHIFVKVMKNFSCKPIAHGGQQKHLIYKDNLYWKIMVLLGQEYWDSERTGTSTSNQHLNSYIINKLATWLYPIFQTYLRRIVGHSWTTVLTGNMLTESMITCKTMKKKNEKSTLNLTIWPKSIWKHQNICKHVLTHKQKYDQLLNKEQTWSIFHAEVEPKLESYASVKF